MQPNNFDLVIIGAGPSGCTASLFLADSGLKVALVDKATLPAEKICGDALSGTVLKILKKIPGNTFNEFLSLEPKNPSWGIRFFAPGSEILDVPFIPERKPDDPPPGYLCKRKLFDGFLQKKVRESKSVSLIDNFQVNQISRENGIFIIKGDKEDLRCRMIIGADGTPSFAGNTLAGHSINYKQYCLGVRTYFTGVSDFSPEQFIELHFLEELLPGYFWIFPMADGIANVGLAILYEKTKASSMSLSEIFRNIISTHSSISSRFSNAKMIGKIEAHGLPFGPDPKAISGEGFLLAGDAASLVDPFTGEGIGNAMVSGELAASMVREVFTQNNFSARFLKEYENTVNKKLGRELKTSQRLQELCSHPALFNLVVKKANRNKALKEMFSRMYTNQDLRDELKNPVFYLKLMMG
ncbi:MAG: geranylgeranyl reductase family protein [Bacteroidales bacterium]|jgi:geranylgeranyl reductase family protein